MTNVIKAQDNRSLSARVRALATNRSMNGAAGVSDFFVPAEVLALRRQVEALMHALQQRDAELNALRGEMANAGEHLGAGQTEQHQAGRIAVLELGVKNALDQFGADLKSMESLAVLLASEALSKILNDPAQAVEITAQILRRQLAGLAEDSVVKIMVSRQDFADDEDLVKLAVAIRRRGADIRASEKLAAGECQIKLVLGALDVGPAQQWTRLSAKLGDIAATRGAA